MSTFARFLYPIPRRTYSSFFSSKSGRYFNSAKPPKSVVARGSGVKNGKVDSASPTSADGGTQGAAAVRSGGSSNNGPNEMLKANADEPCSSHSQSSSSARSNPSHDNSHPRNHVTASSGHASWQHPALPSHAIVNSKEFKLHQFFSLHRPLLLLSHPPSILRPAPSAGPLYSTPPETDANMNAHSPPPTGYFDTLDETPDAAIDADAEAARQLTRALTMSRAGGAVSWESTLRRLGMNVDLDPERVGLQQQMDSEWEVIMDSTRRKRKKKMKKHK